MTADKDIWNEFKNEEADALSFIYSQNIDFLFFYGKRFTSDEEFILDIIQDLFYDLIKYRKSVSQTDNIRLYLLKSFRRKLLHGIEIKQKLTNLHSNYNHEPDILFSIEEKMINDEEQSIRTKSIRRGLLELNAKQREVIYYKFTLGYDYDQICEIMSINYDSARQLVSRGISSLKQFMSENKFILLLIYRRLITK